MSSVNSRTLPKPLIVKNYIAQNINEGTFKTLFTIPIPAGTAYQFSEASTFSVQVGAGAEANSLFIQTQVDNIEPTVPYLKYFTVSEPNVVSPNSITVPINGILYNSSEEEVFVQFRAYLQAEVAGDFTINSQYPAVYFWEVPIAGFKVLA